MELHNIFSLSHDLARLRDHNFMRLCGWECLMVSHHAAKFGSHKHCGSGDIIFLVVEEQDLLKSGIKDMV